MGFIRDAKQRTQTQATCAMFTMTLDNIRHLVMVAWLSVLTCLATQASMQGLNQGVGVGSLVDEGE